MEEAAQGSPGLCSRGSPASALVEEGEEEEEEEGFLRPDPAAARADASDDSPAPAGEGGQPREGAQWAPMHLLNNLWSRVQGSPAPSSDRKHSAGDPPGASPVKYLEKDKAESAAERRDSLESEWQHLEQDQPGGRSDLKAGTAASRTKLESELQVLRTSTHPLALELLQTLARPTQIIAQLLTENQQLREKLQSRQDDLVAHLLAENQQLRQELQQERKSSQRAPGPQRAPRIAAKLVPWKAAFPVQLWVTGQTKGCEKQFMDDVTRLLAGQRVSLQVEDYQENSRQFLLLFCPVASRLGSDVDNALQRLSSTGVRKALLVVCHFRPKGSVQPFVGGRQEVRHPALVTTVHACYSLQDGFYHCQMNQEAVAAVAAAIASELAGD